jgi:hypothetical protein
VLSHLIVPEAEDVLMELGTQVGLTFLFLVVDHLPGWSFLLHEYHFLVFRYYFLVLSITTGRR